MYEMPLMITSFEIKTLVLPILFSAQDPLIAQSHRMSSDPALLRAKN